MLFKVYKNLGNPEEANSLSLEGTLIGRPLYYIRNNSFNLI